MERDHQHHPHPRSKRRHALAMALVCLELISQALSLSTFPSSVPVRVSGAPTEAGERTGVSITAGQKPGLVPGLLRELFDPAQPMRADQEDEDREPTDWPRVELVVRQKVPAATAAAVAASSSIPSHLHAPTRRRRIGSGPDTPGRRPLPLRRLIC